jgi:ankyrin repeat protein
MRKKMNLSPYSTSSYRITRILVTNCKTIGMFLMVRLVPNIANLSPILLSERCTVKTIRCSEKGSSKRQREARPQQSKLGGDDCISLFTMSSYYHRLWTKHVQTVMLQLHAAAQFGHLNCVKLLVKAGVNARLTAGRFGLTPLRAAVKRQHPPIVKYLLDVRVLQSFDFSTDQLSAESKDYYSTLTFVCRNGNVGLVQLLLSYLEQDNSILGKSEKRSTWFVDMSNALHNACTHGHTQIVALSIDHGVDIEKKSNQYHSPLTAAASAGDLETMKVLLAAGAVLYDAKRTINILKTLIVKERSKQAIDFVIAHLLNTAHFIDACKEVPAYMRAWHEDAAFVLNINTMPSSERLLMHLAALGAQRSIQLKFESLVKMTDVSASMLQAAAYFQSHGSSLGSCRW